jgi:hypothetical protein
MLHNGMLQDNLWNRKPSSKIVFCYGDKDDQAPLFNSEKAYTTMKGADVKLNVFKRHAREGIYNFMQQAFTTFPM